MCTIDRFLTAIRLLYLQMVVNDDAAVNYVGGIVLLLLVYFIHKNLSHQLTIIFHLLECW